MNRFHFNFMKIRYKKPEKGIALTVELIPKSCQGHSLYHQWPSKWWDKLRKIVYSRANFKCEVCGSGPKVECHEVWEFNIEKRTQKLVMLVCLCHDCHSAKHFGHAYMSGHSSQAIKHLCKVNSMSLSEVLDYIDDIYQNHKKYRGIKFKKKLDLSLLSDFMAKYCVKDKKVKRVKSLTTRKTKAKARKIKRTIGNYKKGGKR